VSTLARTTVLKFTGGKIGACANWFTGAAMPSGCLTLVERFIVRSIITSGSP
jgi:hypothetical protein